MVHPDSVITTLLQDFNQDFYDALTDKEYFCYEDAVNGTKEDYMPFFTDLNAQLENYLNSFTDETQVFFDMTQSIYSFIVLNTQYGVGSEMEDEIHGDNIFSIGGLVDDMISRPVDYYDDFFIDAESNPRAPNLEADIDHVETAPQDDINSANTLTNDLGSVIQDQVNKLLYEDQTIQDTISKEDRYTKIFVENRYSEYYDVLQISGVDPFE